MRTTKRSQLSTIGIIALAALLAGCAPTSDPGEPSESPAPTATTSATPETSEASEPTTEPSPTAPAGPPQCGDASVLHHTSDRTGFSSFPGTDEEVLAAAQPRAGFIAPEALDGLEVLCAVTYLAPTNGGPGVVEVSSAYVVPGPGVEEQLAAWATANGYVADDASTPYAERSQPRLENGDTTKKVVFGPIGRFGGEDTPSIDEWSQQTGVALTGETLLVSHSDFTIPQS